MNFYINYLKLILYLIVRSESKESALNESIFRARIVGIFVADSELPYTLELAKPSIDIAIQKAKKLFPLISWDEAVFRNGSNRCTSNFAGVFAAEEYYLRRVTVFIGPSCGLALDPVARMAAHWNIPVISSGGTNVQFSNKNIFSTLTRLSFSLTNLGSFLVQILRLFLWKNIAIIVHETPSSPLIPLIKRSITDALDPIIDIEVEVHEISRTPAKVNLKSILMQCSKESRIIIMLAFGETVRQLLLTAFDLNMRDYVFLTVELFKHSKSFGNFDWFVSEDPRNEDAKLMYANLMVLTVHVPTTDDYHLFSKQVIEKSRNEFNTSFTQSDVNVVLAGFHDSVLLYGLALSETLIDRNNPLDGYSISRRLWNRSFSGFLSGDHYIDDNGDKETDYTLNDFDVNTNQMKPVLYYSGLYDKIVLSNTSAIHWPNGYMPDSSAPFCQLGDYPECKQNHFSFVYIEILAIIVTICLVIIIGLFFIYRKLKLEAELQSNWWTVKWNEIVFINTNDRSLEASPQCNQFKTNLQNAINLSEAIPVIKPAFISPTIQINSNHANDGNVDIPRKASYKGIKVSIKPLNIRHLTISREILVELKIIRDLVHENVIRVIGLCPDEPFISILTEFCEKGNLREMLDNQGIRIDWVFKYSLISDVVEGMTYIHESALNLHSNLKSSNCLIDNRLVVKLTDFGLHSIRNIGKQMPHSTDYKSLLWTSPEQLRLKYPALGGSQKGDVYSFSIVLQEIVTRSEPFGKVNIISDDGLSRVVSMDPFVIYKELKAGTDSGTPLRPHIDPEECPAELYELMNQCWDESATNRPSFVSIKQVLKKITKDIGSTNFLENLLSRMEQYANDLEVMVDQKTSAFFEEKAKCEQLLYEVLPKPVADQLIIGHHVKPESFECVTIMFSDIVHFTQLSSHSTPIQIVQFLNDLYTLFDSIISDFDVYKVETIGDAYMVVSGLPVLNGDDHALQIARMSLQLLEGIKKFKIQHLVNRKVELRIGIHSGPVCAGVVGLKMPRYCLFGDTVNMASRMESTGMPNKIHMSGETMAILDQLAIFHMTCRGDIDIKGKGIIRTYFLDKQIQSHTYDVTN